jgi:hypothetical protein
LAGVLAAEEFAALGELGVIPEPSRVGGHSRGRFVCQARSHRAWRGG